MRSAGRGTQVPHRGQLRNRVPAGPGERLLGPVVHEGQRDVADADLGEPAEPLDVRGRRAKQALRQFSDHVDRGPGSRASPEGGR